MLELEWSNDLSMVREVGYDPDGNAHYDFQGPWRAPTNEELKTKQQATWYQAEIDRQGTF